jgi:spore coat protein U-like protein
MKKIALIALAVAGVVVVSSAQAGTNNLTVSADVQATCSVGAAAMAFGTYDTLTGSAVPSTQTDITFTCSNGTTYTVALDNGLHYDATGATRRMQHSGAGTTAADHLAYALYEDSGLTTAFDGFSAASTGASQTVSIWGEIANGQTTAKAGAYADTVVITVTAN